MSAPAAIRDLLAAETPLAGEWTFYADRATNAYPMGAIAATGFTCNWPLNDFGKGAITIPAEQVNLQQADMLRPFSWRLFAMYEGEPVWGGLPTGIADAAGATVTVSLIELPGYLARRAYDVPGGHTYTQVEQTQIAAAIAAPLADILVPVITEPGSPPVLRDRTYEYLEGPMRADLLSNLSGVIGGPEFRSEYRWLLTPGQHYAARPECRLRIAYPRVGSGGSGLVVKVPATALEYSGTWDGDKFRTHTFAVGELPDNAPQGATKPVKLVVNQQTLAGMPRLDAVDDWPGVVLLSTLTERANTNSTIYGTPAFSVTASGFVSQPPLRSYRVGDDVKVSITDALLPDGLTVTGRLADLAVDAVTGKVTWTITLTQPPAQPRQGLAGRLARLDTLAQAMFRRNSQEVP